MGRVYPPGVGPSSSKVEEEDKKPVAVSLPSSTAENATTSSPMEGVQLSNSPDVDRCAPPIVSPPPPEATHKMTADTIKSCAVPTPTSSSTSYLTKETLLSAVVSPDPTPSSSDRFLTSATKLIKKEEENALLPPTSEATEAEKENAPPPPPPPPVPITATTVPSVTQIRKVSVKNLRYILSDSHILNINSSNGDCCSGVGSTAFEELQKMKKPELISLCQTQLRNGTLSLDRFRVGSVVSSEPRRRDAVFVATAAAPDATVGGAMVVKKETEDDEAAVVGGPMLSSAFVAKCAAVGGTTNTPTTNKTTPISSSQPSQFIRDDQTTTGDCLGMGVVRDDGKCITTLIVCPVSVMGNWQNEIDTHVREGVLNVELYHGPNRSSILPKVQSNNVDILIVSYTVLAAEFTKDEDENEKKKPLTKQPPPVINSKKRKKGGSTDNNVRRIFDIHFHRVILDEAHVIRNTNTRAFKACHALTSTNRFCITGTPVQNKPDDVLSLFAFLRFQPLCSKDVFRRAISQPIKNGDNAGLARLRYAMCHILLRRNKDSANLTLPKRHVEIRTVTNDPDTVHRKVYDLLYESAQIAFRATYTGGGDGEVMKNYMSILEALLRIRQACCTGVLIPKDRLRRAELVMTELLGTKKKKDSSGAQQVEGLSAEEGRILFQKLKGVFSDSATANGENDVECAICLEEFLPETSATILRTCQHVFCDTCINKVSTMTTTSPTQRVCCPLCRQDFDKSDMIKMSTAASAAASSSSSSASTAAVVDPTVTIPNSVTDIPDTEMEYSPKVHALLLAINEMRHDEKGVIFSQFTKYLDVIGTVLGRHGHTFTRIDGSMKSIDRVKAMKEFNNGNNDVVTGPRFILCSLKAAGTGISLTRANHCFMMDLWWNAAAEDQAMDRVHRIGQQRQVRIVKFVMEGTIEERLIKIQEAKAAMGKGTMEKLNAEEMRKARVGALKDLFQITS